MEQLGRLAGFGVANRREFALSALRAVTRLTAQGAIKRDDEAAFTPHPAGARFLVDAKAEDREGNMFRILVLLVAVATGCGVATAVTVAHAPAHVSQLERGY